MDFARNQLLKYGWKEGKGLGRNESGIVEALKPKLKFDNRGIGHDASEQFTYHWWEHAFNNAANNIQVSATENGVTVGLQDESVDITTKKYSMKSLKKKNALEYGTFLKTSTLTEGGRIVRVSQDIPEVTELPDPLATANTLSDEDLYRICGGRTAHKGARHGLKLNGKLARIEEQEKLLIVQRQTNKMSKLKQDVTDKRNDNAQKLAEENKNEKIKKKKLRTICDEENIFELPPSKSQKKFEKLKVVSENERNGADLSNSDMLDLENLPIDKCARKKIKKSKKLRSEIEDEESRLGEVVGNVGNAVTKRVLTRSEETIPKQKKHKKRKHCFSEACTNLPTDDASHTNENMATGQSSITNEDNFDTVSKKKKRKQI